MDCVILAIQMYSHSIEIEILSNSLLWRLQSKIAVVDFSLPWKENHTWSYCDINIEHSIFKFQFQESTLGSLLEGLVDRGSFMSHWGTQSFIAGLLMPDFGAWGTSLGWLKE
jgi:hypothetical protein